MDKRFGDKLRDLERQILEQPGTLDPLIRQAASRGDGPAELAAYVEKVRLHAYEITDGDVDGLRALGYSEDQIFELTVAAAYGAACHRLEAGLRAMAARGVDMPSIAQEPVAGTGGPAG